MEKDTLGKMIDLYVEKELEERFSELANSFLDLLYMYEHFITYDKKLDTYVVSFEHYSEIKRATKIIQNHLKEKYKVEPNEEQKTITNPTYEISQDSLNLVKGAISYNEQYLENIKKLPEKAVFVNVEKSILMLDIENKERELLRNWVLKECFPKELKAFEIIKEKKVNVRAFLKCCHREDGLTIYNNQCDNKSVMESKELTQEEYDSLKEVLLCNSK